MLVRYTKEVKKYSTIYECVEGESLYHDRECFDEPLSKLEFREYVFHYIKGYHHETPEIYLNGFKAIMKFSYGVYKLECA